jgi:hypothetical protein
MYPLECMRRDTPRQPLKLISQTAALSAQRGSAEFAANGCNPPSSSKMHQVAFGLKQTLMAIAAKDYFKSKVTSRPLI